MKTSFLCVALLSLFALVAADRQLMMKKSSSMMSKKSSSLSEPDCTPLMTRRELGMGKKSSSKKGSSSTAPPVSQIQHLWNAFVNGHKPAYSPQRSHLLSSIDVSFITTDILLFGSSVGQSLCIGRSFHVTVCDAFVVSFHVGGSFDDALRCSLGRSYRLSCSLGRSYRKELQEEF